MNLITIPGLTFQDYLPFLLVLILLAGLATLFGILASSRTGETFFTLSMISGIAGIPILLLVTAVCASVMDASRFYTAFEDKGYVVVLSQSIDNTNGNSIVVLRDKDGTVTSNYVSKFSGDRWIITEINDDFELKD